MNGMAERASGATGEGVVRSWAIYSGRTFLSNAGKATDPKHVVVNIVPGYN